MEKQSIAALKKLYQSGKLTDDLVASLRQDERKGVQQLIRQYDKEKEKEELQKKQFLKMKRYEMKAYAGGIQYIAGVDEAGRGPLAGPVVAAAVILPKDFELLGLNDSKQLNEATRNRYSEIIKEQAICYAVTAVDSQTIDQLNIFEATKLAMRLSIQKLEKEPEHILIDAVRLDGIPYSQEVIIKGDEKSISIAAASILAKVERDRYMKQLHKKYPMYGFDSHMGYGTKKHLEQLQIHGITPHHRQSFSPVQKIIESYQQKRKES